LRRDKKIGRPDLIPARKRQIPGPQETFDSQEKRVLMKLPILAQGCAVLMLFAAVAFVEGCSSPSQAQSTNPSSSQVLVVNTAAQPVPVAAQGTANVNISNASLPVTGTVAVSGLTALNNADNPGRIAYQSRQYTGAPCVVSPSLQCFTFGPIPAGHRLVVQHIAGLYEFSAVPNPFAIYVLDPGFHGITAFSPTITSTAAPVIVAFDQPVQFYIDASQTYIVEVLATGATVVGIPEISVMGYMLDCTAAPCAAIAQ
jgi:hypothetical protein